MDWLRLSRLRHSHLSRAASAVTVTAFLLSNAGVFELLKLSPPVSIRIVFAGCLFFLIGYIICEFKSPPEFKFKAEIYEIIQRKLVVSDSQSLNNIIDVATKALNAIKPQQDTLRRRNEELFATIKNLDNNLKALGEKIKTETLNHQDVSGVYDDYLNLIKFDRRLARLSVTIFLCVGLGLMIFPTMFNVVAVVFYPLITPS